MAHVRKRPYTKPVPAGARLVEKDGVPVRAEWSDPKGRPRKAPVTRTAKGLRLRLLSRVYWVEYTDRDGRRRSRKGYTDRQATEQLAARLERREAQKAEGLADPYEAHRSRPVSAHLDDFRAHLEARDNSPAYVGTVLARLRAACEGCGFATTADLDAARADAWVASLRRDPPPVALPPGAREFTVPEAARLLGVKLKSVSPLVRRHRLEATGAGRSRRLPRGTVEALLALRRSGASVETSNQYLAALKNFGNWLAGAGRAPANPFARLKGGNADADRRHPRRELTEGELRRLLAAALASDRSFRGLTGGHRYHLYACACGTGFRAAALASLTPGHFDLDADPPTVELGVRKDKSRRGKVQPLPADVADILRAWLAGRPRDEPLWPGTWAKYRVGADLLRIDLDAAGIPYAADGPDGPEYADFHALRHTYLTLGGRAGIDLRTLQELAGHSTPVLTARYSHRRLHDLAGAVGRLPRLVGPADPAAPRLALGLALDARAGTHRDATPVNEDGGGRAAASGASP